jgi:hypothetical protein
VSRHNAAVLAPLMDARGLRLEGIMPFGAGNQFKVSRGGGGARCGGRPRAWSWDDPDASLPPPDDSPAAAAHSPAPSPAQIPMDIHLFCPRASLAAVQHGIQRLPVGASCKYINYDVNAAQVVDMNAVVKGGGQAAGAAAAAAAAARAPSSSAAVAYRGAAAGAPSESDVLSRHLDSLFVEPVPYDAQPQAAQPAAVVTPMYPHQLKAVAWMAQREAPMTVKTALEHQRRLAAAAAAAAATSTPSPSGKGAGSKSKPSSSSSSSSSSAAAASTSSGTAAAEEAALARIVDRVRAVASTRSFFWQEVVVGTELFYENVATGQRVRQPPQLPRGGILADVSGGRGGRGERHVQLQAGGACV